MRPLTHRSLSVRSLAAAFAVRRLQRLFPCTPLQPAFSVIFFRKRFSCSPFRWNFFRALVCASFFHCVFSQDFFRSLFGRGSSMRPSHGLFCAFFRLEHFSWCPLSRSVLASSLHQVYFCALC